MRERPLASPGYLTPLSTGCVAYFVSKANEARMGLVINPRGTSGAGKTWLVRIVMAAYCLDGAQAVPLRREGRHRPMGWCLAHPRRRRPLAVIGHYAGARGGTDTIPLADGGLDEAFRLADVLIRAGNDVLLEGLKLSGDVERTAALARTQRARGSKLHVICLNVPLGRCTQNAVTRRRAGRQARLGIERTVRTGHAALAAACEALRHTDAEVEWLDATAALRRTFELLDLDTARHDEPSGSRLDGSLLSMSVPGGPALAAELA